MKRILDSKQFYHVCFCWYLQHYWLPVILVMLSIAWIVPPAHAAIDKKHVLVLHSYHKGFLWTDDITEGISRVLFDASFPIDVQYEYMDSKKIFDKIYMQQILDLYHYKFRNKKFDAILSSDDNAFNFLRDYREQLFPDTPVIYCGTNYMTKERAAELPNATGVNEAASLKKNIKLILKLHPQATHLAIVIDSTTTGNRVRQQVDEIMPTFNDQVKFVVLQDLTIGELANKISSLPATAVVLYTIFFRDRDGEFIEYDESIDMVTAASVVPVYVTWDFSMGNGALGGLLASGIAQGEAAAKLALQVLMGKPANSIPYVKESPNKYIFDYNALQRFSIDVRRLPVNAFIRNQPDELYKKYRELIWQSMGAGTVLIFIIGLLTTSILRRRRAENLLSQANEKLEERVRLRTQDLSLSNNHLTEEISKKKLVEEALKKALDEELTLSKKLASANSELTDLNTALIDSEERYHSLSDAAFEGIIFTKKDIVIESNEMFSTMLGYESSELIDKAVIDLVPPEDRKDVESKLLSGYEHPYEARCLRKDGSVLPVKIHAKKFSYKGEQVRVAAIRDLTEKKRAEEEIYALKGVIPICMHCKGIRDDKGYWNKLEQYISKHSEAEFSHGICDNCLEQYYPE